MKGSVGYQAVDCVVETNIAGAGAETSYESAGGLTSFE